MAEFGAALALLTRLPGGALVRGTWPDAAPCVWAYPIVGALMGAIGGAALWIAERSGVPRLPACVLAIALVALVTGGLHEDGLSDTADGLAGRTPEARLAIMRDSRIGSHGALALALVTLFRVGALASMTGPRATAALVVASVLGRASMLLVIGLAPPARGDGLGASVAGASRARLALGLVLAASIALPVAGGGAAIAAVLLAGVSVALTSRRLFGGLTGDVLGAAALLGECAALLALCAPLRIAP